MKLMRKNVIEINNVLALTNYDHPISSLFRYAVSKNLKMTKEEIDEINSAFPTPEQVIKYQKERNNVFETYNIRSDIEYKNQPEDVRKSVDDELNALNKKYEEILEEVKELDKDKMEFLEEEIDIPLKTVKIKDVPTISSNQDRIKLSGWDIYKILERIVEDE